MGLFSGSEYLEDWLPWELCLDARRDVVLTRTGGLLCAAQVWGPDLETASPEALDALHARLVDAFDGLGTGWSVWLDQWRVPAPGYLPGPPATAPPRRAAARRRRPAPVPRDRPAGVPQRRLRGAALRAAGPR